MYATRGPKGRRDRAQNPARILTTATTLDMKIHLALTLLIASADLGSARAFGQTPPSYSVNLLGPANSVSSLSENGLVAGQRTVGTSTRGYVASVAQPMVLLPLPPNAISSWAIDISEQGVVVGAVSSFTSPEFFPRPARWVPDGSGGYAVHEFGFLPGDVLGVATAVNNHGDIVGYSGNTQFRKAVWFTAPLGLLDLNPYGVFDPDAINDERVFVDRTAKRMNLATLTVESLGLPSGPPSYQATTGYDLNELGSIAGTAVLATSTSCVYQAARYVDGTGWEMLTPCSSIANAFDINDQGDVLFQQVLSLLALVRFEGIGSYTIESLLEPSATNWDIVGASSALNSARQIAVIVQDSASGASGVALLDPVWTCQTDLGFAGPGHAQLAVCGGDLSSGTTADLTLWGLPVGAPAFLVVGNAANPIPLAGGTLVPLPIVLLTTITPGSAGTLVLDSLSGGFPGISLVLQAAYLDAGLAGGVGFSNAVQMNFLP